MNDEYEIEVILFDPQEMSDCAETCHDWLIKSAGLSGDILNRPGMQAMITVNRCFLVLWREFIELADEFDQLEFYGIEKIEDRDLH